MSNTGKSSETAVSGGNALSKNDILIHFIGTADELNAHLGLVKAILANEDAWQVSWQRACQFIEKIQKNLMKIMSHVCDAKNDKYFILQGDVIEIENEIKRLLGALPKQKSFSLPGKNIIEAQIQIARTVARRVERLFVTVNEEYPLCPHAGGYLNRLSDYLYFLSQQESLINVNFINQITGI